MYCEHEHKLFFISEPVNTITNLSFIIAGIYLVRYYQKLTHGIEKFLVFLIFLIGAGSAIWHGTQTLVGELLDVFPIFFFIVSMLYALMQILTNLSEPVCRSYTLLFGIVHLTLVLFWPDRSTMDLVGYAPVFIILIGSSLLAMLTISPISYYISMATGLFIVSYFFRSIDLLVCPYTYVGTHFIWHILNSIVLVYCVKSVHIGLKDV